MSGNEPEVFLMLRYPPAVGGLSEDDLDSLFTAIRKSQAMYSIGCTLGAAMTTCEAPTSPFASSGPSTKSYVHSVVSKYESQTYECSESRRVSTVPQTPRVLGSAGSSLSSASSGPPLEMTQGFYCKSAPAYVSSQSDVLNPTIVVEMYQETVDLPVRVDDVTKAITIAIQTVILEPRSINHIGVRILRYIAPNN